MSDDRSWSDHKKYITFREYVQNVVGNSHRGDELSLLIQQYGMEYLDLILSGTKPFDARDLLKSKNSLNN